MHPAKTHTHCTGKIRTFSRYFAVFLTFTRRSHSSRWYLTHHFREFASNLQCCIDLIAGMHLTFGKLLFIHFLRIEFPLSPSFYQLHADSLQFLGLFANCCDDTIQLPPLSYRQRFVHTMLSIALASVSKLSLMG